MDFKVIKSDKMSKNVFTFIIFIAAIISIHFFLFLHIHFGKMKYTHGGTPTSYKSDIILYNTEHIKKTISEKLLRFFFVCRMKIYEEYE